MGALPIEFHPEARLELIGALEWYSERSHEAAQEFYQEVGRAQEAIQKDPNAWAVYLQGTRRYLLKRFKYVVIYRVFDNRIQFIALAHGNRKPGYWVNRLKSDT